MDEAAIALTAALGAAFLTAAGSIGVIWYKDLLRNRSGDSDALAAVVIDLLNGSFALAMRATPSATWRRFGQDSAKVSTS